MTAEPTYCASCCALEHHVAELERQLGKADAYRAYMREVHRTRIAQWEAEADQLIESVANRGEEIARLANLITELRKETS